MQNIPRIVAKYVRLNSLDSHNEMLKYLRTNNSYNRVILGINNIF